MKREDWKAVEDDLRWPGAFVHLQCDSYLVTLMVSRKGMRMEIVLYIGGVMKGEWLRGECEESRRFFRVRSKCAYRPTRGDVRTLGKKWVEQMKAKHTYTWRDPIWPSVTLLRRHFEKHNTSIERVVRTPEPAEVSA